MIIPSNEVLQKYSKIVGPYFIKMNQIMQENQQLSKLRNELLPLLMNGQVSIAYIIVYTIFKIRRLLWR